MPANPTLSDKLSNVPMLRALIPMLAGIVAGAFLTMPLYVWIVAAAICVAMAWLGRGHAASSIYVHLAILFFGAAMARTHLPEQTIPHGERVWMEVRITDNPAYRGGKSARTSATAERWRTEDGQWRRSGERLLVSFDTVYGFRTGDRLVFRGYVNPVSDTVNSYSRLMRARGYTGRIYISAYSRVVAAPDRKVGFAAGLRRFQEGASERLHRLKMPSGEMAVAAAMTLGDRRGITPELRSRYSRTGAMHLLSVSGLHVGIVFMLVNALLYLLPLMRRGHVVKNIAAAAAIWIYAAMAGFSPSVVRAAAMFTGAQAALAASSGRNSVNIMAGTAFIMLAVNPNRLFDISFQLSFIAVGAIMAWFGPLYRLVACRWKILNALWSILVVSFIASLATMPLVSHSFGVFSIPGIILNPIVILTAHLVVMFSLLWVIAPIPLLEPVFRWLVGGPAWLQNKTVELAAGVPDAAVEYSLPGGWVLAVYAAMIIFTAWLASRPSTEKPFTLPR